MKDIIELVLIAIVAVSAIIFMCNFTTVPDEVRKQRDAAFAELREIREFIGADPEESTADEVRRIMSGYKKKGLK